MYLGINLLGGSGSGCSTIGARLAKKYSLSFIDGDDLYWLQTDLPFQEKRPPAEREKLFLEVVRESPRGFVLSGSADSWGEKVTGAFNRVILLDCPTEIRLKRIEERERLRFGRVDPEFLAWAAHYEEGDLSGRSLPRHKAWLATLTCPIFKIDSSKPEDEVFEEAVKCLSLI